MKLACGVAAALLALTVAMTWPLLAKGLTTSVPGDYGDPLLATWAMGWVARTLTAAIGQPSILSELWNANIFFPEQQTLAFSEHFIGQSLLVLPIYWATGNLILCYNVAFVLTFVLSGVGTFLLTRSLVSSGEAARHQSDAQGALFSGVLAGSAAAIIIAFNQYRLTYEVAHLHVLSIHWLPFALYGFHRYLVTDSRWALALGALALVALNLSSVYYMAYCAPFVVAFVVVEMLRLGRWRDGRAWLELWAAAAVVTVVMLPFVLPYMAVQQRLGVVRRAQELVAYSATLDHYRIAVPGLVVPAALAVLAFFGGRTRRVVLALSILALLGFSVWLSFGRVIQSGGRTLDFPTIYPILHDHIPGYNGLRVPARFAMLFFFFLALLAGLGAERLATWMPRFSRPVLALMLVAYLWQVRPAALPLDQPLPSPGLALPPSYLTPSPDLPGIYREVLALTSDAVLLELPFGDPWYELRYMFFAAMHGRRLINGYSGVFPPSYIARQRVLAKPLLDPGQAIYALGGATHVIVHRSAWPDGTGTKVSAWLEAIGAQLVASSGDALLYQIQSSERMAFSTSTPAP